MRMSFGRDDVLVVQRRRDCHSAQFTGAARPWRRAHAAPRSPDVEQPSFHSHVRKRISGQWPIAVRDRDSDEFLLAGSGGQL